MGGPVPSFASRLATHAIGGGKVSSDRCASAAPIRTRHALPRAAPPQPRKPRALGKRESYEQREQRGLLLGLGEQQVVDDAHRAVLEVEDRILHSTATENVHHAPCNNILCFGAEP